MAPRGTFSDPVIAKISNSGALRIKAGSGTHRFLGIWAVVVERRVFVRSWNVKPDGWHQAWLDDPLGAMIIDKQEIAVRAIPVRTERLRDAVSAAYLEKYWRPGSLKYAQGFDTPERRAATLELVPLGKTGGAKRPVKTASARR
jgi:hypothetical protein